ncbi:MAG: hypothetical protein NT038_08270 [Euryarchaeota archaeon]|nr:hypothetical protein [Euryarchaeota archaeon]
MAILDTDLMVINVMNLLITNMIMMKTLVVLVMVAHIQMVLVAVVTEHTGIVVGVEMVKMVGQVQLE